MLPTLATWNKRSTIWAQKEGPRPEWLSGIGRVVSSVSGTQAVDRAAGLLLAVMEAELIEPYPYPEQGPELGLRLAKAISKKIETK